MPTVIDANVLIFLFSKKHQEEQAVRIRGLINDTRSARARIIIPSPAFAEFAVLARPEEIDFVFSQPIFKITSFDAIAALECGYLIRDARQDESGPNKRKIKFDLQILAIAKTQSADRLVTDDAQLIKRAASLGIKGVRILELPIPDNERQLPLLPKP